MLEPSQMKDRVIGCVMGGAVGDALGAPFEGLWARDIPPEAALMAGYAEFEGYPPGQYTDDTQLTIATLQSIIKQGHLDIAHVAKAIARLWRTQAVIGPGGACTQAATRLLAGKCWQEAGAPPGQAGNGTAMRTALLGFLFLRDVEALAEAVSDVSRITHRDSRSVAGGVAVAAATRTLALHAQSSPDGLCAEVAQAVSPIHPAFGDLIMNLPAMMTQTRQATLEFVARAGSDKSEFDDVIITPFIIPTVLAALWAVMAHGESWTGAVAAAIGLGGDVDTLGAIVGGLMGAKLGYQSIPPHLAASVVDADKLEILANRYWVVVNQPAIY